MYNILICDDEQDIINALKIYLSNPEYSFFEATNGRMALETVEQNDIHLILMDIMMPGMDGISAMVKIREISNVPVILLTAKSEDADKIMGLNSGADDYLVKPFGVMEMVARVKAVLRRTAKEEATGGITVGNITLKETEHKVIANGEKVELTHKEFELLKVFLQNPNMVFSRDKLMSEIWGMDYIGETRTVDMHIKTLRHKLGKAGGQIKTVIGVGYRLESEV